MHPAVGVARVRDELRAELHVRRRSPRRIGAAGAVPLDVRDQREMSSIGHVPWVRHHLLRQRRRRQREQPQQQRGGEEAVRASAVRR